MKLVTITKYSCHKLLTNVPVLSYIHKFKFSQLVDKENILEFSDLNDETANTETNPIIESLTQNKTYQTVLADPSSTQRSATIDNVMWKRQNRNARETSGAYAKNNIFAGIQRSKSIGELHKELETFKNELKSFKTTQKKQSIMDILDSISGADNESETEKTNVSQMENVSDKSMRQMHKDLMGAYECAIKRCGFLKEFEEGFKIFEYMKKNERITARIYGAVIWLTMEKEFSEESLDKCFDYLNEMEERNLEPTAYVYSELIKAATALRIFKRAGGLVNKIIKDQQLSEKYLQHSQMLRAVIMNYYAKTGKIEKGLQLMNYLSNTYGREMLRDDLIYSSMILACAYKVKNGDKALMEAAEKLFQQSFDVLERVPSIGVFNAFINCYSCVPDIESCIDLLKSMKEKSDWPDPNTFTFGASLKAVTQYCNDEPLSYEKGWEYVNEILDMFGLNENNISGVNWSRDDYCAIYGLLFTLCGGQFCEKSDLEKLYKYYDDMEKKGIKLNSLAASMLLMAGVDHYKLELLNNPNNKEQIKEDVIKYIDWALLQFKKYNLNLAKYQNDKLQKKLNEIM